MTVCTECRTETPERMCPRCGDRTVPEAVLTPAADPLLGTVLKDTFRIEARIGAGGMAVVYRGRQLTVEREVAIKVLELSAHRSPDEALALVRRFRREAKTMSLLQHPNTVRVIDFGESDAGMLFIVMELLRGVVLREEMERVGRFAPARVARIGTAICKALAEAHAQGIVHRDLKPGNVFLADVHGERDFVKVVDFGIAKLAGPDDATTVTGSGVAIGTPKYMAPEQAVGKDVGPWSDLYALGALLYHMLSGAAPFQGDTAMEVMYGHLHTPPLDVDLPGADEAGWTDLLGRLLAKEPRDRPPGAEAVAAELARLENPKPLVVRGGAMPLQAPDSALDATPIRSPMDEPDETTRTESRGRRPALLAAGAGVAAVALAFVVWAAWPNPGKDGGDEVLPPPPDATSAAVQASVVAPPEREDVAAADTKAETTERAGAPDVPSADVFPDAPPAVAWGPLLAAADMVLVPSGAYPVGCPAGEDACFPDERPAFTADLAAFGIGRAEVTAADYAACVAAGACRKPKTGGRCNFGKPERAAHPANCVDWEGARAYCAWKTWRLPTEREWEAAARGQDGRSYPWGNDEPSCVRAVLRGRAADGCAGGHTAPSGSVAADVSPAGALDMGGNVREWTADTYAGYPQAKDIAASGDRVNRGGSWQMPADRFSRAHTRLTDNPAARLGDLGFRCAMDLPAVGEKGEQP